MQRLTSNIVLANKYRLNGVVEAESVSTWDMLTDTASVTIPKLIMWQGRQINFGDNPIFRRGNQVEISFGYDNKNEKWFEGYMTRINAGIPIKIDCQDAMFLLKKGEFVKSYKNVSLKTLLKDMIGTIVPYEVVADYDLGSFRTVNRPTIAQVIDKLRQDYFIRFWFRDGKLYAGLPIIPKLQKEHKIKYVISNNLEYQKKEDVKIQLKGVIMLPNNKKKEIKIGDNDAEVRTIHRYNISETEMKRFMEQEMENLKYEGYKGSFTTFLEPNIQHGDIVKLPSLYDVDTVENGRYIVKKVTKYFKGIEARQEIELERRIR